MSGLLGLLFVALGLAAVVSAVGHILAAYLLIRGPSRHPTAAEYERVLATLRKLLQESDGALGILRKLETEVSDRAKRLADIEGELQQRKVLVELSEEQKKAFAALRPKPSFGDIVLSLDFWAGRVLVNVMFFLLGLLVR